MAHEIHENNYIGDGAAWHQKGVVVDGLFDAATVIKSIDFDFPVELVPLYTGDGEKVDRFATIRTDREIGHPHRILGVVGPRYTVVQNADAFTFFDKVVGEGEAIYTSAGILGHGERMFLVAEIPGEFYVEDDKFEQYVVLNNSHDGTYALRVLSTSVRVVCQNTLSWALRQHKAKASLRHTKNVHTRMIDAAEVLGLATESFKQQQELFRQLVSKDITHELFSQYVDEVFPSAAEEVGSRTLAHREEVMALIDHPWNTTKGIKHTWYAALQATTQYVDHAMSVDKKQGQFEYAVMGAGAKRKKEATSLAQKFFKKV